MNYTTTIPSPAGRLTLASDGAALTGLWIEGQKYFGGAQLQQADIKDHLPLFEHVKDWLERYFAHLAPTALSLPLKPEGSDFRKTVLHILCEIPYGQVTTYGEIAKEVEKRTGRPVSAQAVGGAVGHNPISIIIPCHRVIGANGSLTGYAGGLALKRWLLALEGIETARFSAPGLE